MANEDGPIIFGMFRECLALANKAIKEGRHEDEIRYTFATPGYFLFDLIILPLEIFGVVVDKLEKLLPK